MDEKSALGSQLESFREARRDIEASVLPLATSVDGRRFSFQASLHGLELQAGGYAVLETTARDVSARCSPSSSTTAGRELTLPRPPRAARRPGRSPGPLRARRGNHRGRQQRAVPRRADPPGRPDPRSGRGSARTGPHAQLRLGELALAPGVPCVADAGGFDRHTFLCGQSGSGKTYSLGVILERLLIETDLRMVILDPNSDFVRLRRRARRRGPGAGRALPRGRARGSRSTRPAPGRAAAPAARGRDRAGGPGRRCSGSTRSPTGRSTPRWRRCSRREDPPTLEALTASDRPEARRLACASATSASTAYGVWAPGEAGSVLDAVHDPASRCVVIDLGSLPTREEQSLVAGAVLGDLWRRRAGARAGADRDRRGAQRLPGRAAGPARPRWRPSTPSGSPPRAVSSGSTCCCRRSARRRSPRTSSPRPTTWCSCG